MYVQLYTYSIVVNHCQSTEQDLMRKTIFIKILEEFGIPNKWSKLNSEFTLEPKSEFAEKIIHYYSCLGQEIPRKIIIRNKRHNNRTPI